MDHCPNDDSFSYIGRSMGRNKQSIPLPIDIISERTVSLILDFSSPQNDIKDVMSKRDRDRRVFQYGIHRAIKVSARVYFYNVKVTNKNPTVSIIQERKPAPGMSITGRGFKFFTVSLSFTLQQHPG